MLIKTRSYARAGLLGNPSDGFFGKTISFTMSNFVAELELWESPEIHFVTGAVEDLRFDSLDNLLTEIGLYGYYGGIRLLKATTKVFVAWCRENGVELPNRNFTVRYLSTVPRLVGMGGSSALCTAMFRALMQFYEIDVPMQIIPTLCLRAETEELTIQAGLQDRVIQVYDGVMFMDFDEQLIKSREYGDYKRIDKAGMPNVYVAYDRVQAEVSGKYHGDLHSRFDRGDSDVIDAMHEFADIAQRGYECLTQGRPHELSALVDQNFDVRERISGNGISPANRNMVSVARDAGASAKFAGSGGTIVGTYEDDAALQVLREHLEAINCEVVVPEIPDV
jgi:glucuronokinase